MLRQTDCAGAPHYEQNIAAGAGELHGGRETGKTSAHDNGIILHGKPLHVTFDVMYLIKLRDQASSSDVTRLVA